MEKWHYEAKTVEGKIKERFETIHNVDANVEFERTDEPDVMEVCITASRYIEDEVAESNFFFGLHNEDSDYTIDSIDYMINLFKKYADFYQQMINALEDVKELV
jgi:hypothetical protein